MVVTISFFAFHDLQCVLAVRSRHHFVPFVFQIDNIRLQQVYLVINPQNPIHIAIFLLISDVQFNQEFFRVCTKIMPFCQLPKIIPIILDISYWMEKPG